MAKDLWLPKGFTLPNGARLQSLIYSGDAWQIYETTGSSNVLLCRPDLARRWFEGGFLDEALTDAVSFGPERFCSLSSHKRYSLAPVENGEGPETKEDALAFALALKASRQVNRDVSFHDAVYVEQYSRLLPSWTLTPHLPDEVVLGTWMTGGVVISTDSFRRLTNLIGWMSADDVAEVIRAAGLVAPKESDHHATSTFTVRGHAERGEAITEERAEPENREMGGNEATAKVFRLPGRKELEVFFNEHVIDIVLNSAKYHAMGITFPAGIVLHGPPGCGKTFAVDRLVEFLDWPCYPINSNSVGSPYIHETSRKVSQVFDKAIQDAPSIIVIDEMESFLSHRRSDGLSSLHHVEEVAEFLRRIPEAIDSKVLVIGMTNMIELIDPAVLRRGRFDHIIEVGMPSREDVASLIDSLFGNLPTAPDLNRDAIYDALTGRALSDATFVIREAARLAAKAGKDRLDQESIEAALALLPSDQQKRTRRIGFSEIE